TAILYLRIVPSFFCILIHRQQSSILFPYTTLFRSATEVFDLMAKFADYGFNKSHAAAYSLVAYQTAYLKVHYPAEFMAALMTLRSEEHTSELQSRENLVCRLLLDKKN